MSDIPRSELVKGIIIVVLTRDIKSNRLIAEEKLEWDDPEARKWLGRITYRALVRGCTIETMNEVDYEEWRKYNP